MPGIQFSRESPGDTFHSKQATYDLSPAEDALALAERGLLGLLLSRATQDSRSLLEMLSLS